MYIQNGGFRMNPTSILKTLFNITCYTTLTKYTNCLAPNAKLCVCVGNTSTSNMKLKFGKN